MGKTRAIFFPTHKARGLPQVPRALRLIEDSNVFRRSPGVDQQVIAKVMNVLDKSFDTLSNFPFPHSNAIVFLTCNLVTGECFMEHSNKRAVS